MYDIEQNAGGIAVNTPAETMRKMRLALDEGIGPGGHESRGKIVIPVLGIATLKQCPLSHGKKGAASPAPYFRDRFTRDTIFNRHRAGGFV
jgi:hypothetical protein